LEERCFLQEGKLERPFSSSAQVCSRGYSLPLQRRITDFGSDESFGGISEKMKEHYGITVPVSSARVITLKHAEQMRQTQELQTDIPERKGIECVIGEADGSMVPIVRNTPDPATEGAVDRRKTKQLKWEEARLTVAYAQGTVTSYFGATMGSSHEAGNHLLNCAIVAGIGQESKVHCVGDGAPWIAEQVNRVFGLQGEYLIDYYHLCEYLGAAAPSCAPPAERDAWLQQQKTAAKQSRINDILTTLTPHLEPESVASKDAPVRAACRYIQNRPDQFDYKSAQEAGLPIGSGEVESAHRSVIQERLKIPGAWWKVNNADHMLALRTIRANGDWDCYWQSQSLPTVSIS
jgi:hypothetical protein